MPLIYIVRMSSFNIIFTLCIAFLELEIQADYEQILEQVKKLYRDTVKLKIIITDRELTLINILIVIFPKIPP